MFVLTAGDFAENLFCSGVFGKSKYLTTILF
jgi:hypothetical protein